MSIFVTGDIHGSYDIHKLASSRFDARDLSKDDYLIICGDFGLVWDNSKSERYWLRWLDEKPFTTLFVDGNHEGFTALNELPIISWHGGKVHQAAESVFHLMRGELFELDGRKVFAMGGAKSSAYDIAHRVAGISWFPEEIPSSQERDHAKEVLENANWDVDLVITHCAPTSAEHSLELVTERLEIHPMDEYTDWLDTIKQKLAYKHWFCGHYHVDASLDANIQVLYQSICKVANEPSGPIRFESPNNEESQLNPIDNEDLSDIEID